jgi:hypothetical protein
LIGVQFLSEKQSQRWRHFDLSSALSEFERSDVVACVVCLLRLFDQSATSRFVREGLRLGWLDRGAERECDAKPESSLSREKHRTPNRTYQRHHRNASIGLQRASTAIDVHGLGNLHWLSRGRDRCFLPHRRFFSE